jgi:hypothetical protein
MHAPMDRRDQGQDVVFARALMADILAQVDQRPEFLDLLRGPSAGLYGLATDLGLALAEPSAFLRARRVRGLHRGLAIAARDEPAMAGPIRAFLETAAARLAPTHPEMVVLLRDLLRAPELNAPVQGA